MYDLFYALFSQMIVEGEFPRPVVPSQVSPNTVWRFKILPCPLLISLDQGMTLIFVHRGHVRHFKLFCD